jgi:hypothetical protein
MNAPVRKDQIADESPNLNSGFAVVFYLLTILAGGVVFFVQGRSGFAVVTVCYLAVTALFHDLFKPASRVLSLLAASRNRVRQISENSSRVRKQVRRTI